METLDEMAIKYAKEKALANFNDRDLMAKDVEFYSEMLEFTDCPIKWKEYTRLYHSYQLMFKQGRGREVLDGMKDEIITEHVKDKAFENFRIEDSVGRDAQFYSEILEFTSDPERQNEYIRLYHAYKSILRHHRGK